MQSKIRGFTLLELLVVVTIIALLLAILLPSLAQARERTKTVFCASSMKQIGQLITVFAQEHDNRGPGRCTSANPKFNPAEPFAEDFGGVDWADILKNDLLGNGTSAMYGISELSDVPGYMPGSRTLRCPNFMVQPNSPWSRPYGYNYDCAGGIYYAPYGPPEGWYGKKVDPATVDATIYSAYAYGAQLGRFTSGEFLLVENERRNDWSVQSPPVIGSRDSGTGKIVDGSVTAYMGDSVNNDPSLSNWQSPPQPAWSAHAGQFSFRHPYFKKANFLYFDCHVDMLRPSDNVDSTSVLTIQNPHP